jgi:hypothetical protein
MSPNDPSSLLIVRYASRRRVSHHHPFADLIVDFGGLRLTLEELANLDRPTASPFVTGLSECEPQLAADSG